MTTRSEREKAQKQNEQHQAILAKLLREDDNKYCADCQAKGPRWASWNLGVFMCIRCAGIHRNLGVHISRVKSVNLDQWTPEQIQSMVDMGNQRARRLYEAHLPDSFQRPQTDQAVEVFIRDKYERKRFYNQEALAAAPKSSEASSSSPPSQADRSRQEKEREKTKKEKKKDKESDRVGRRSTQAPNYQASPVKSAEPAVDLLSLDAPEGGKASGDAAAVQEELDIFGPMVSNPLPSSSNNQQAQSGSSTAPPQAEPGTVSSSSAATKTKQKKLLSKDSILSLYASSPTQQQQQQQQPAAGQGVFMGQFSTQGFPPGAGGAAPTGALTSAEALPNGGYMAPNQGQAQGQAQGQWSINQMNQQISGLAVGDAAVHTITQPEPPTGGWAPPTPASSGQTLSTQLWK